MSKAKYTTRWWNSLSTKTQDKIADAITSSSEIIDLLDGHMNLFYKELVSYLKKLHIYIDSFDYSAAQDWAECQLDWDEEYYVSLAEKGKATPSPSYGLDVVGVANAWGDISNSLDDAMKEFRSEIRHGEDYDDAKDDLLEEITDCMVEFSDRIEGEVLAIIDYHYEYAADDIIPDYIEDGVFDKVIDKYLKSHSINESYGRRSYRPVRSHHRRVRR